MNDRRSHYEVLGVPPAASADEVREAYRRAARRCHPDAGGSAEEFERVNAAYRVLGDRGRKRGYDQARAWARPHPQPAPYASAPHHSSHPRATAASSAAPRSGNPPGGTGRKEHRPAGEAHRVHRTYLAMMVVAVSLFVAAGTVIRLLSVPVAFSVMVVAMLIPPAAVFFANHPHDDG